MGSTADRLNSPRGIFVDASYALFIVDRGNHRVQRWLPGRFKLCIEFSLIHLFIVGAAVGTTVAGETAVAGSWSYQLNSPTTLMFDQYGFMYVLDAGNSRIQKWMPGMTYGTTVVTASMSTPLGISFDLSGNIIVADTSNQRVISFNTFCGKFCSLVRNLMF